MAVTAAVAGVLGLGLGAAGSTESGGPSASEVTELEGQLDAARSEITGIEGQLSQTEGELSAANERARSLRDKLRSAREEAQAAASVAPAPAAEASAPAGDEQSFSGNGGKNLGSITVPSDSVLEWTNDGEIMQIFDDEMAIGVNSQGHEGDTVVPAGTYENVEVNAMGNWTITIRPGG
jgi:TolA-binding protein